MKWKILMFSFALSGSAMALNWDWDGGGGADTSWTNGLNWRDNVMYSNSDIPIFRPGDYATVDAAGKPVASVVRLGQDGTGTSEIEFVGGSLSVSNHFFVGYRSNAGVGLSKGVLTFNSGTLDIVSGGRDLILANQGSDGILNMYGGNINVADALILRNASGHNTLGLYGGTLTSENFIPSASNTTITVGNGLWVIGGNETSDIQGLVNNGLISTAVGATGADVSAYTFSGGLNSSGDLRWGVEDGGDTIVFAIPEPASLGLISAMGFGILWVRRLFSI